MKHLAASLRSTGITIGLISLLTACGGGGGGTSDAEITAENMKDLAIAATESAKSSVSTTSINPYSGFKTAAPDTVISAAQKKIQATIHENSLFSCINNGTVTDNLGDSPNGTITFNNCEITFDVIVNGSVVVSGNQSQFTLEYQNFTVTAGGKTETVDMSVTCTSTENSFDCTVNSDYLGIDNRTYSVSDVKVSGDAFSGYNVTATVTDPDHGKISINAKLVKFDCTAPNAGRPSTGSIVVTSGTQKATVTFNSCTSYTVVFEGVGENYNW